MTKGITKELLEEYYFNQKKNFREIGEIFGCHGATICNFFKRFGIKPRSISEASSLVTRTDIWKERIGKAHKGRNLTAEQREKISKTRKERKIKPWNTGKNSISHPNTLKLGAKKENHWNWKGGISKENVLIRQSPGYKLWRRSCYERDDFTCQNCKQKSGKLNVHHIKPFADLLRDNEDLFDINNGITLCVDCHKKEHESQEKNNL